MSAIPRGSLDANTVGDRMNRVVIVLIMLAILLAACCLTGVAVITLVDVGKDDGAGVLGQTQPLPSLSETWKGTY